MKHNVAFDGIRKAMKHVPEELDTKVLVGNVTETTFIFSDEYKQIMKEKHPDWYKESL